jgi:asparagine synthase (glutamine-hydrolysing)
MCGIAALVGLNRAPAEPRVVGRMIDSLRHRGPDSSGIFHEGSVCFGFRRLSILDLSETSNQPMRSEDGRVVLVFNGEIYNYLELRAELEAEGHRFRSTGDAEVLLNAYLQWGRDCTSRFNGMWSFLIWDSHRQIVFGSRDRLGKKPLFYHRTGDCILFASEIKAILASGRYHGGPNWPLAATLLLEGNLDHVPVPRHTFFEGIEQIPAATSFELELSGEIEEHRYWSLNVDLAPPANPAETFYGLFEDSVRLRLRSDVPVGVFLSGGLDSTAVACSLARQRLTGGEGIYAFSFHSEEFDESSFVADTVAQTQLHLVRHSPRGADMWENIEKLLRYQDEPVHSFAAVAVFELSRLAAERGVKVILSGGGADECLAGYGQYFSQYWYQLVRSGCLSTAWAEIDAFAHARGTRRGPLLRQTLRKFRSELGRLARYRALRTARRLRSLQADDWYTGELKQQISLPEDAYEPNTLDRALRRSVNDEPLPFYLRIDDRNSMAWSVELRSPFLDYRLIELAFSLPASWKMRGPWSKFVLREAMKGRIPESVRTRIDKWGFPIPAARWFATDLYEPVAALLADRHTRERGIYDTTTIARDLDRHREGRIDASARLFNVLQFELWMRSVVEERVQTAQLS